MTQDEKRIKIAEACGAKIITREFYMADGIRFGKKWARNGNEKTPCAYPGGGFFGYGWNEDACLSQLPDYFNDLNAMHEAEKFISDTERVRYGRWLHDICATSNTWPISAEPHQRAEAFGLTLNLWEQ